MKILRNDVDNSINFQRASSTLDGCVKIWTSRVDSVQAETGKLLSNLANQRDSHEDEDSDNPDADPTQIKKKRAHRPAATLVKDPVQLRTKKLDLEFYVDPLFKKTCADFDEGGAHGLLMNHLSLGVGSDALRIIFDASDSKRNEDEENVEEPVREIDISDLQRESAYLDLGHNKLTVRIQVSSSQISTNSKTRKSPLHLLDSNFLVPTLPSMPPLTPILSLTMTRSITLVAPHSNLAVMILTVAIIMSLL